MRHYEIVFMVHPDQSEQVPGMVERYNQISFELIDLESGVSVWANMYEFKKAGLDDAVYR